ncbi:MAG: hypothetical protein C4527_21805 [Candidatus Omnitrophota bacterium]|nr:MAG: hypothetical protein C4527_21805 [Candidatus Omnitrophota bacterium]
MTFCQGILDLPDSGPLVQHQSEIRGMHVIPVVNKSAGEYVELSGYHSYNDPMKSVNAMRRT